jgi:TatD DNase family protein
MNSLTDTHAHLDFPEFADDLDAVLRRAKEAGVTRIITIGTSVESSLNAVRLAESYPEVYAAVGIHPNSAIKAPDDFLAKITELAKHPKVVAIGETGLDYFRLPSKERKQEISEASFGASSGESLEASIQDSAVIAIQTAVFEQHLELAASLGKSVIIHQRDSWDDTIAILKRYTGRIRAVVHCFNTDPVSADEVLQLGFHLSFTGIVTFKNAKDALDSAVMAPIDRLMVETDCPFLAPVPNRGKRCEPAFVRDTAIRIAEERGLTLEEFAASTSRTAEIFFDLEGR